MVVLPPTGVKVKSLAPTTESQKTRVPAEAVVPKEELSRREVGSIVFTLEARKPRA
jgi:hypothetical protein